MPVKTNSSVAVAALPRPTGDNRSMADIARRLRQMKAYFGAPRGKPIDVVSKSVCFVLVAAHSAKVVVERVGQGDPRKSATGYGWPGPGGRGLRQKIPG
jgi:hypothetical protein